jgi:hypothetical protein
VRIGRDSMCVVRKVYLSCLLLEAGCSWDQHAAVRGCRASVQALSEDKSVLTAALTTAQVQLKEATPAGFAAEAAELRRQVEAAMNEAANAKAATARSEARLADAQRRETEVSSRQSTAAHERCSVE